MVQVTVVKAFTEDPGKGNPAGVVLEATDETRMLEIASAVGTTATAFLRQSADSEYTIRFFSPQKESSLCVHALLASAHLLMAGDSSERYHFSGASNGFEVSRESNGSLMVTLPDPVFGKTVEDVSLLSHALGTEPEALGPGTAQVVSAGKPKIIIPFKRLEDLKGMQPNLDLVTRLCVSNGAEGIFPFTSETLSSRNDFHARHFNPIALSQEDPICGNGSGALAAYLEHHGLLNKPDFEVEMGHSTNLPGTVLVDASDGLKVGGFAVKLRNLTI